MKIKRLLVFLAVLVFVSNLFSSMTRGNDESFVGEGATYTCICIVNITSPEDESVVTKPEITVSGYASEECGIVYLSYLHKWENGSYRESWNIETPAPTYEFEFPITLREGWNSINVSAMGACGVTGFDEIILTTDSGVSSAIRLLAIFSPGYTKSFTSAKGCIQYALGL